MKNIFSGWRHDLPASLVVFLVALPLCLGVALASTGKEPILFSGIIAGAVGGIVVGMVSGSRLGVSGPAAGLIMIVSGGIATVGGFDAFLVAVILAGLIQFISGFLGAGVIGNYFPTSVIKGMLAAIGLTLILKEIPHAFGYDADFMGDESFFQVDGQNTFTEIMLALSKTSPGAICITLISMAILILFDKPFFKKYALFKLLPGALFVVVTGVCLNILFSKVMPDWHLKTEHLVQLPKAKNWSEFRGFFTFPDFSVLANYKVYLLALTIALVASLESLLSVQATDKLDPAKNNTPTNLELKAQGLGNMISGFLGGLPVTQVIVRSSANINAGAKSKLSTIFHGILLLVAVVFFSQVLNLIPLSALAGILIMVGYKLSKVSIYKEMFQLGMNQFIPFLATILGVLFTDLLKGIAIGMFFSLLFAFQQKTRRFDSYKIAFLSLFGFFFRRKFRNNVEIRKNENCIKILFYNKVSFLNKPRIISVFNSLPENHKLIIDASECQEIEFDILEAIQDFKETQFKEKKIHLETINITKFQALNTNN